MPESLYSCSQPRFNGAERPAQFSRNFALTETLVVRQLDYHLLVMRQGMNGKIKTLPAGLVRIPAFITERGPEVLGIIRIRKEWTARLHAQPVQGSAPGDG